MARYKLYFTCSLTIKFLRENVFDNDHSNIRTKFRRGRNEIRCVLKNRHSLNFGEKLNRKVNLFLMKSKESNDAWACLFERLPS